MSATVRFDYEAPVPALADLCAVDLVEQPGREPSRRIAVAARDPADEALLRALCAAGAPSHAPVHGGSAASTNAARAGLRRAQCSATAAPIEIPPTAIGPSAAAASRAA